MKGQSRMADLSPQQGQRHWDPQTAVNFHFHFNWPWHTLDDFLHNKSILLVISLINLIINWANI